MSQNGGVPCQHAHGFGLKKLQETPSMWTHHMLGEISKSGEWTGRCWWQNKIFFMHDI